MRRREFITLLGGAAAGPLAARAQQPTISLIGFLHSASAAAFAAPLATFRKALHEAGYVEGQMSRSSIGGIAVTQSRGNSKVISPEVIGCPEPQ